MVCNALLVARLDDVATARACFRHCLNCDQYVDQRTTRAAVSLGQGDAQQAKRGHPRRNIPGGVGHDSWREARSRKLFDARIDVVCAPDYADRERFAT